MQMPATTWVMISLPPRDFGDSSNANVSSRREPGGNAIFDESSMRQWLGLEGAIISQANRHTPPQFEAKNEGLRSS